MAVSSIDTQLVDGGINIDTLFSVSSMMVFTANVFVGNRISAKVNSALMSGLSVEPIANERGYFNEICWYLPSFRVTSFMTDNSGNAKADLINVRNSFNSVFRRDLLSVSMDLS